MSKLQLGITLINFAKLIGGSATVTTVKFKGAPLKRKLLELDRGEIRSNIHHVFNAGVLCGVNQYSVTYAKRLMDDGKQKALEHHILYDPTPRRVYELLANCNLGVEGHYDKEYPNHPKELIRYIELVSKNVGDIYGRALSMDIEDDIMLMHANVWGRLRLLTSTDSPAKTLLPCLQKIKQIQQGYNRDRESVLEGIDIYDNDKNELLRINMDLDNL